MPPPAPNQSRLTGETVRSEAEAGYDEEEQQF
jgi:hypothetical protein